MAVIIIFIIYCWLIKIKDFYPKYEGFYLLKLFCNLKIFSLNFKFYIGIVEIVYFIQNKCNKKGIDQSVYYINLL